MARVRLAMGTPCGLRGCWGTPYSKGIFSEIGILPVLPLVLVRELVRFARPLVVRLKPALRDSVGCTSFLEDPKHRPPL